MVSTAFTTLEYLYMYALYTPLIRCLLNEAQPIVYIGI